MQEGESIYTRFAFEFQDKGFNESSEFSWIKKGPELLKT